MKVSFKGLANVSAYRTDSPSQGATTDKLIFQVNNEGEHKDLDNFREILKAFPDPYGDNFINMDFKTLNNGNYGIMINYKPFCMFSNMSDEYKIQDEVINNNKWKILSTIFNAVKRIKKGEEKFPIDKEYLNSMDCTERMDYALFAPTDEAKEKFIEDCHKPENLKINAKRILPEIQSQMENALNDTKIYSKTVENISGFQLQSKDIKTERLLIQLSDEDIKELGPRYEDYRKGSGRNLIINRQKNIAADEDKITINNWLAPINERNSQMLFAISKKLKQIANDKHPLSFPFEYKNINHLNKLYAGYDKNLMINITNSNAETLERQGISFNICESSSDLKQMANAMAKKIDKDLEDIDYERNV